MIIFSKIIAGFFGIGFIQKGAGTVAALFCCLIWFYTRAYFLNPWLELCLLAGVFFMGVFTSIVVEEDWGHDSNRIVIDEVLGMLATLFLIPAEWPYLLIGFVSFRFFDIAKPLFIRKLEQVKSGWGVMLDDLLAGIYSNLILQVLLLTGIFE